MTARHRSHHYAARRMWEFTARGVRQRAAPTILSLLMAVALPTLADDTYYWSGGGFNDNFSNPFNWFTVSAPVSDYSGSTIRFEPPAARSRIDLNGDWSVYQVYFDDDDMLVTPSYEIYSSNGSELTIGYGGITSYSQSDQTISADIEIVRDQTWFSEEGSLYISGRRQGDASTRVRIESDNPFTTIHLAGSGAFQLGNYSIRSATLSIGDVDAISASSTVYVEPSGRFDLRNTAEEIGGLYGEGTVIIGDGSLGAGLDNASEIFRGTFIGARGEFRKLGTGTYTLTGNNVSFSGLFAVENGTLVAGGTGNAIGDQSRVTVANGATFSVEGDGESIGSLAGQGTVSLAAALGIGFDNTSSVFEGAIVGNGNVAKHGSGRLTLAGVNTFVGDVTVNGGTLELGLGDTLTQAHAVTLGSGTELRIARDTEDFGSLAGTGVVVLDNAGMAVGYDNTTTAFDGKITGNGSFTKAGSGQMTLAGNNEFSGNVQVLGGTLELGPGDSFSDSQRVTVGSGATLRVAGNGESFGSLAGAGNVVLQQAMTVGANGASTEFSGVLSGAGQFTKSGAGMLTLSGRSAVAGPTLVNGGTLRITGELKNGAASIESRPGMNGSVRVEGAGAYWQIGGELAIGTGSPGTLGIDDGGTVFAVSATLGNRGTLNLAEGTLGVGTLVLAGGTFNFTGGELAAATVRGDLVNTGGTLAPGSSPGLTTIIGSYTQGAAATLEIELADYTSFDVVSIEAGAAILGGRLLVDLLDGFDPVAGSVFDILTAEEGIALDFASIAFPILSERRFVLSTPAPHLLRLTVEAASATIVPVPPALWLLAAPGAVLLRRRRKPLSRA